MKGIKNPLRWCKQCGRHLGYINKKQLCARCLKMKYIIDPKMTLYGIPIKRDDNNRPISV